LVLDGLGRFENEMRVDGGLDSENAGPPLNNAAAKGFCSGPDAGYSMA
jgi:hypothetical protein